MIQTKFRTWVILFKPLFKKKKNYTFNEFIENSSRSEWIDRL